MYTLAELFRRVMEGERRRMLASVRRAGGDEAVREVWGLMTAARSAHGLEATGTGRRGARGSGRGKLAPPAVPVDPMEAARLLRELMSWETRRAANGDRVRRSRRVVIGPRPFVD